MANHWITKADEKAIRGLQSALAVWRETWIDYLMKAMRKKGFSEKDSAWALAQLHEAERRNHAEQ